MAKPNYRQINGPNHPDGGGNAEADCGSPNLPEHLEPRRYFSQTVLPLIAPQVDSKARMPMNSKTAAVAITASVCIAGFAYSSGHKAGGCPN
ncbi:hypothetical protein [Mesorhizobium sp. M0510]|uniref:hypothetical protein n=1 Tax=unclassified Mesorhizobium TaxID=325217 RepID=UPI00333AA839